MQKIEKTASFQAKDDAGETTTIHEYTRSTLFSPISGAEQWLPGSKSYKTSSGEPVNFVDAEMYQNVMTEKLLRRIR